MNNLQDWDYIADQKKYINKWSPNLQIMDIELSGFKDLMNPEKPSEYNEMLNRIAEAMQR